MLPEEAIEIQHNPKTRKAQNDDYDQDTSPNSNSNIEKNKSDKVMINDILESWRYYGKPLKRERIAFGDFIDLMLT